MRLVLFALSLCMLSCAQRAPVSAIPHSALPLWTYTSPAGENLNAVAVAGNSVLATDVNQAVLFDARTGKRRWSSSDAGGTAAMDDTTVYASGPGNHTVSVVALNAASGAVRWRSADVCAGGLYGTRVTFFQLFGGRLYAGCGERLSRIDAQTGRILLAVVPLAVNNYYPLQQAGPNVLAISGWGDGAALHELLVVVRERDFSALGQPRQDAIFLGVRGNEALLDDRCCWGRPDEYRPATIVKVSLAGGKADDPIDLRPDPQKFTAPRPVGQGSGTALVNGRIFLHIAPMLYEYDPCCLTGAPKTLRDDLEQVPAPMFLSGGGILVRARSADGTVADEVLDLREAQPRVRWSRTETETTMLQVHEPGIVQFDYSGANRYATILRTADLAEFSVTGDCSFVVSDGWHVVMRCMKPQSKGYSASMAVFAFPHAVQAK